MKKILLIIKLPPPYTGATFINTLVYESSILSKNFTIDSICIHYSDTLEELGIISFRKVTRIAYMLSNLIYKLIFFNPDLVYFQISPLGIAFIRDIIFVILIKMFHVKIVYHLHGKGIKNVTDNSAILRFFYKFAFRNEYIICLSHLLISDIRDVYSGKPFVVNNCIKSVDFNFNRQKIPQNGKTIILFLSNFLISKGLIEAIEAVENIIDKGYVIELRLVGNPTKEISINRLEKLIYNKKLNNFIKIIGPKYDEKKNEELFYSDILIFPTNNEAWGLVVLEAMQFGLPVIATNEGSLPEIIDDGVTGYLIDKNDPRMLAEKIEILIKNKELRYRMGFEGHKKFLKKYTYDIFERNMVEVFENILMKNKD